MKVDLEKINMCIYVNARQKWRLWNHRQKIRAQTGKNRPQGR